MPPDRLSWAPDRQQLRLAGIQEPFRSSNLSVTTLHLRQIRTGLHSAPDRSGLRLVFDFTRAGIEIATVRLDDDRIQIVVR